MLQSRGSKSQAELSDWTTQGKWWMWKCPEESLGCPINITSSTLYFWWSHSFFLTFIRVYLFGFVRSETQHTGSTVATSGIWFPVHVHGTTQLCPTLCNPVDCSPPGSSVHGILQARILEWVAISFSRGSSQPRDWIQVSCIAGRRFNLWATSGNT